ncbi:MAG: hypothetical protein Q8K29_05610 [Polaromonas sp.]|nr:hypothetical protein [Polaromonas sp.]
MRHLVLALMIALLPIRGWVGDVMATEMAAPKAAQMQNATELVASHAHGTGAGGHFDHVSIESHVEPPAPDCAGHGAGASLPLADAHCESCTVCQACHTVALSPLIPALHAAVAAPALPRSPAAHFASATAALGQKPPIS